MSGRTVGKGKRMSRMRPNADRTEEYLRRNLLHAASVGALAGVHTAFRRLLRLDRRPQWLVDAFIEIGARLERLPPELAAHRDEVKGKKVS